MNRSIGRILLWGVLSLFVFIIEKCRNRGFSHFLGVTKIKIQKFYEIILTKSVYSGRISIEVKKKMIPMGKILI